MLGWFTPTAAVIFWYSGPISNADFRPQDQLKTICIYALQYVAVGIYAVEWVESAKWPLIWNDLKFRFIQLLITGNLENF